MMKIIGCDMKRVGERIIVTMILALVAGFSTGMASMANGDLFGEVLGLGLLAVTAILVTGGMFRLFQRSLFKEEAHFLMTLPVPAKKLLRGKVALGVMWIAIVEMVFYSPILCALLFNEVNTFEADQMQMIIYRMMEWGSSPGEISVFFALIVPLVLIVDGLFSILMLYLCFLVNHGKKKAAALLVMGTVAAATLLGIGFAALLQKGSFPFGMIYVTVAGCAVVADALYRRCTKMLDEGHDVL